MDFFWLNIEQHQSLAGLLFFNSQLIDLAKGQLNRPTSLIDHKQISAKWNKTTAVYSRAYGIYKIYKLNTHDHYSILIATLHYKVDKIGDQPMIKCLDGYKRVDLRPFLAFLGVGVKRITDTAASAEVCHKYQKAAVNHVGLKSEEAQSGSISSQSLFQKRRFKS